MVISLKAVHVEWVRGHLGVSMKPVWGVPEAEIVKMAKANTLESYIIMVDTSRKSSLWKFRVRSGREDTIFVHPSAAIHFMHSVFQTEPLHGWVPDEVWPRNQPTITDADQDYRNSELGMAIGAAVLGYPDAVVLCLKFQKEILQVFRIRPRHAMQMARLLKESVDAGWLIDLDGTPSPSTTRQ